MTSLILRTGARVLMPLLLLYGLFLCCAATMPRMKIQADWSSPAGVRAAFVRFRRGCRAARLARRSLAVHRRGPVARITQWPAAAGIRSCVSHVVVAGLGKRDWHTTAVRRGRFPRGNRSSFDDDIHAGRGVAFGTDTCHCGGVLYGTGFYMMLRRRLAQLIIGLGLLSNGTNLLLFTAGGLTRARPPIAPEGARRSYNHSQIQSHSHWSLRQ